MTIPTIEQLVTRIHDAPTRIVLAITGGGSGAIAALLETPGGSRTLLEAVVPYSSAALDEFLGATPEHYCSDRTARAMAIAAFERARHLAARGDPSPALAPLELARGLAGVGCTASLASDRPKRGEHRIHVAYQTLECTVVETVVLAKGLRDRAGEERLAAHMSLNLIAEACGLGERVDLGLAPAERIERAQCRANEAWQRLLVGEIERLAVGEQAGARDAAASCEPSDHTPRGLFPGAFNPRHAGHLAMAAVAARRIGAPVEYEISIANVDKPPLDYVEIDQRVRQFAAGERLWLTAAPTFERKSRLFDGCTFVVGADTALRITEAKYYGHDDAARDAALAGIASRGCRFLVFGRTVNGRFQAAESLDLPHAMRAICDFVAEAEFRQDMSSTEIRRQCERQDCG